MYRYGWNERTVGLAIAAVGLCSAVVGAGLVEPVVARFGERRTMLAGLLFGTAGFLVYGMASTGAIFWSGLPLAALWGLSGPPMQGMMTRHVGASEQGQLQGALSSLRGIAFMIGPLVFTNVFASFIGANRDWHLPGAPFLLAALMIAGSTAMAWQTTRSRIILPEPAVTAAAVTEE
jgi:MFS transporter, DHA1 family, tetracycline resistance protein